jgi:hypothetical protein
LTVRFVRVEWDSSVTPRYRYFHGGTINEEEIL